MSDVALMDDTDSTTLSIQGRECRKLGYCLNFCTNCGQSAENSNCQHTIERENQQQKWSFCPYCSAGAF